MKLLSIVIPSYNSEKYISQCLKSLLIGRDDELDVIVVNDGSTDNTSKIAHKFADEHSFVRVVDKPNAGHGSGVNVGIELAKGLYFKILDSDDLLDEEGLLHLLDNIKKNNEKNNNPDLYMADYCSYPENSNTYNARISFQKHMKKLEEVVSWVGLPRIGITDFFMIHMCYVKTKLLQDNHVELLERTFYEDNQFMFYVLIYTKTLCYLTKPIYKYTVGRKGQSISLENMSKKYEHQHRVMRSMIEAINYDDYKKMHKHQRFEIRHDLSKIAMLTYFYTYIGTGKERHRKYKSTLRYFKNTNPKMYRIWRREVGANIMLMWIPPLRHQIVKIGYKIFAERKGWK